MVSVVFVAFVVHHLSWCGASAAEDPIDAAVATARAAIEQGRIGAAFDTLQGAARLHPDGEQAPGAWQIHGAMGDLYTATKEHGKAAGAFMNAHRVARERDPMRAAVLLFRAGQAHWEAEQHSEAVAAMEMAVDMYPVGARVPAIRNHHSGGGGGGGGRENNGIGNGNGGTGSTPAQVVYGDDSGYVAMVNGLAASLMAAGEHTRIVQLYQQQQPRQPQEQKGKKKKKKGKTNKQKQKQKQHPLHLHLDSSIFGESVQAHLNHGVAHYFLGDYSSALKSFRAALRLDNTNPDTLYNVGLAYTALDRADKAAAYYLRCIEYDPTRQDAYTNLDKWHETQGTMTSDAYRLLVRKGVRHGMYMSLFQRPQWPVQGLRSRAWWWHPDWEEEHAMGDDSSDDGGDDGGDDGSDEHGHGVLDPAVRRLVDTLEMHYETILAEGLALVDDKEMEDQIWANEGRMGQLQLFMNGFENMGNTKKAPKTAELLRKHHMDDVLSCVKGNVKFATMYPSTHLQAHTGPTNARLRVHLGLNGTSGVAIRVGDPTDPHAWQPWRRGRAFVFDDSYEHEVWHNGTSVRLALIVDMWHPDLTHDVIRSRVLSSPREQRVFEMYREGSPPRYDGIFAEYVNSEAYRREFGGE